MKERNRTITGNIGMSTNCVCYIILVINQIGHLTQSSDLIDHSYDYRANWITLGPITITYYM